MLLLATPDGPAVAGAADGWALALLPGGGEAVGIGASASATVVTGTSIWRSTDGARSFEATPAAPVLGAVIGTPGGFVAASCATGGLVLSPDGRVWTDLPALHPRGVVPVAGGGCSTLAADDEGGVWLATGAAEPAVFRVRDQLVDRLGVPPRPPGTIFAGPPLVAVAAGTVVVAVPQPGGVATSTAASVTLTTDLELDAAMVPSTGATPGHAAPVAVVPLDDRGHAVGVRDVSRRHRRRRRLVPLDDDAATRARWTRRVASWPTTVPPRADRTATWAASSRIGNGDVSLATVDDADTAPGTTGPVGDVVLSQRRATGPWSSREVVGRRTRAAGGQRRRRQR